MPWTDEFARGQRLSETLLTRLSSLDSVVAAAGRLK